jgi:hypothetical protein
MNAQDFENGLKNMLSFDEARRAENVDYILHPRKKIRMGSVLTDLAGQSRTRGVYAYFVERNVLAMKQHFHVATKLTLASVGQDGGESFSVADSFLYGLLSDSAEVIGALANVETAELVRERDNPLWPRFHVHMLQLAIRGEEVALQAKIEKLARSGKKPWRDECAAGKDFYSLLLKRDKAGLEELIQNNHARIKAADVRIESVMSYLGTLEAKLCWIKKIPVQIDSPLLPMELMPVEPPTHYDNEYEFLKPGWTPASEGIVGKLARWFK